MFNFKTILSALSGSLGQSLVPNRLGGITAEFLAVLSWFRTTAPQLNMKKLFNLFIILWKVYIEIFVHTVFIKYDEKQ